MPPWSRPSFEWDEVNVEHILERHGVEPEEAEQVFFNVPRVRREGGVYEALGRDDAGHHLVVIFVVRASLIRVISARPMSTRERRRYDRAR